MVDHQLQAKDLITIGVYTAIYFTVFFACGMLGYIPIFILLIPFICSFVAGIPFMLYLTKVKAFGMLSITGLICGGLMLLTGMSWPPLFTGAGFGLIADLILKSGNYQSSKKTIIAYTVFSVWLMGMMIPLYFMRDSYFAAMVSTYGQEYVDALMSYTPTWSFFALLALTILGGFCGALAGKSVLTKHFKKAGIA